MNSDSRLRAAAAASPWSAVIRCAENIDRAVRAVEVGAMVLSALSISVIALIVCLEVLLRSAFGTSTLVSTEMSGYLLVSNVFLGLAWTFRNGGFIRVELLYGNFRGAVAAFANFAMAAVGTAVLVVYTFYLYRFVAQSFHSQATSIYVSRTPLWIPQLVMPVGSALLTWAMFVAMVRSAVQLVWPAAREAGHETDAAGAKEPAEGWL